MDHRSYLAVVFPSLLFVCFEADNFCTAAAGEWGRVLGRLRHLRLHTLLLLCCRRLTSTSYALGHAFVAPLQLVKVYICLHHLHLHTLLLLCCRQLTCLLRLHTPLLPCCRWLTCHWRHSLSNHQVSRERSELGQTCQERHSLNTSRMDRPENDSKLFN